ncbi:MAG: UDP-N-acetylmuramoyl-tripeptide--D-alanyl-D-alanine ligase [Ignavibacteriaceae bacterium]|nr:UDP-N-acetylmuramoyl-tripeptide--D-alanyl-D-alanine ligase [Ignavibacteriaceae bacterium]
MLKISDLLSSHLITINTGSADTVLSSVSTDSRKADPGSLFVAIKGEKYDGHDFIPAVIKAGVKAILVNTERTDEFLDAGITVLSAPDTIKAYGEIGRIYRKHKKFRVVSLTGSNGKTSTKEILYSLFSSKYKTYATGANNNNHIGVPLTILSAPADTQYLILEIGTNHFGEIEYSAGIAVPDYGVILNIGDSHLEYLINRQGVRKEKEALLKATEANYGTVFINQDDPLLAPLSAKYSRVKTFSFTTDADYKGNIMGFTNDVKTILNISSPAGKFDVIVPLPGENNAKNMLAAIAIAMECGLTPQEIIAAAASIKPAKGRLNRIEAGEFSVVDDTYNANPDSMKAAFDYLGKDKTRSRRIAVLGDMFELGENAVEMHISLAKHLKQNGFEKVFLTGENMKHLAEKLSPLKISNEHFEEKGKLAESLMNEELSDSIVLVKGSRGMKMEEIVKVLIERGNR